MRTCPLSVRRVGSSWEVRWISFHGSDIQEHAELAHTPKALRHLIGREAGRRDVDRILDDIFAGNRAEAPSVQAILRSAGARS